MWRHSGRVALAACLLPASSCAATKCDNYRHLAFGPVPSMAVLETRVPALSGLRDVKPFPVSYVLKRSGYRIVVRAYEKDYGPTATLSVEAEVPMTLKASVSPVGDGASCIVQIEQSGGVKFSWLDKTGCAAKQRIGVAVIDASGAQVAIEEFPFTIVTNGRYCVKDAL